MLKEIPVRVDRELQVILFDRAPDSLAIEVHDHRGRLAEEDGGWVGLDALHVLRHDQTLVQVDEDAIERNDPLVVWNRLVDRCGDLAHLLLLERVESGFSDLHLLKTDQPVRDGNLCVRLDLDRAERGLVAGLAAIGDGAEGHEGCLVLPARDLRLIDEDAAFARQAVHARPAAIDWRRRRSRRGRRLCDRLRRWRGRRRGGRRSWLRRRLTLARRGEHVRRRLHQHAQNRDDRRGAVRTSLVIHCS